ncbi:hypothetical protein C8R46DRAFT_1044794 [Mycena filopes]|nr:hypothetical protein C8R46DRAFT_1044794 [Mycena filopes]
MVVPEKADSGLCNTIILPSPSPRPPWPWVLVLSTFKAGETRPGSGLRPRPVSLLNRNIGKTHGTSKNLSCSATTLIRGGSRSKSIWLACNVPPEHRKCWVMTSVFRSSPLSLIFVIAATLSVPLEPDLSMAPLAGHTFHMRDADGIDSPCATRYSYASAPVADREAQRPSLALHYGSEALQCAGIVLTRVPQWSVVHITVKCTPDAALVPRSYSTRYRLRVPRGIAISQDVQEYHAVDLPGSFNAAGNVFRIFKFLRDESSRIRSQIVALRST